MYKLYYSPGACSLAVHIGLIEADLAFEAIRVNLKEKTYAGGDFKKINPKGSVPVLQLANGEILTEAAVILQYVADSQPTKKLIPLAASWDRYRCLEWLNFIATEMHKGFGPLWKPDTPEAYKEIVKKNLFQKFDSLNKHFESNHYLMGAQYCIADAYLFTVTNWTNFLKIDLTPWPKLQEYMVRIKSRPATLAALNAEGVNK